MIAKGNPHGDGARLAGYLVKGQHGELAELVELRGFNAGGDLRAAFRLEELRAFGTKAETGFFHGYVRLAAGERLTRRQWIEIVAARMERALGFTGQPRAIAFHTNAAGDRHMHIAWSRIACRADGRLFALDPGLYKRKLKELSRALEMELGLRIVSSAPAPDAKTRAAGRNEFEEARRLGTDLKTIRNAIFDCLRHAENGEAFRSALDAAGLILAAGERRDCFVAVDHAGGHHALNKKLTGLTLAQIRQRFSDLDRARLPDVDQAQAMQRTRAAAQGRQRAAREFSGRRKSTPEPLQTRKHGGAADVPRPAMTPSTARARRPWRENSGWLMRRRRDRPRSTPAPVWRI